MIQTVEGVIDADGTVRLLEPVPLSTAARMVMILDEEPDVIPNETALLSDRTCRGLEPT